MDKKFFGKLKSFEVILKTEGWQDLLFLDYDNENDLAVQIKDKIDFLLDFATHWVEIEKCHNGYNYWINSNKKTIIIHDDWLSERRD